MRHIHVARALVAVFALVAPAAGLARTPSRDLPPPQAAGTAVIAGVVVANDGTAKPLRRAVIQLSSDARADLLQVTTDDDGRFRFSYLPAGRYTLTARKSGFVTEVYGARRPGSPGSPIPVTDAQRVDVTMKLTRTAAIAGTLLTTRGLQSTHRVTIMRWTMTNGERRLVQAPGISAGIRLDEHGRYRVFGLTPGDYVVAVTSAFVGGGGQNQVLTAAELRWAQQQFQPQPPGTPSAPPPPRGQPIGFATVYYPGTTDANAATIVTVGAGEERTGVDFPVELVPMAIVSGTILDADGRPLPTIQANMFDPTGSGGASFFVSPAANGTFSLTGVAPGHYAIVVRASHDPGPPAGSGRGSASAVALPLWAVQEIDVNGHDLTDLAIRVQPGATVSGRIVFEGTSLPPPADFTNAAVTLTGVSRGIAVGTPSVQPRADGTFTISGVAPSRFRLGVTLPRAAGAWWVKTAMVDGRDAADDPFEVPAGQDVSGVVVTMTDRFTALTGALLDPGDQPAPQHVIVAFPTNRGYWTANSRRIAMTRPATDGTFTITGLPPGDYHVCALTDLDTGQQYDPAFLAQLVSASATITLAEGEKKTQDLRIRK